MAKKQKFYCKSIPTGFPVMDIMLGENIRDKDSMELIEINRGFPIGTQGILAGIQGAGKSTFIMDSAYNAINMGFPCHKIIVIDADEGVYKEHRIRNLAGSDNAMDKVAVYETFIIEEIWDILVKEDKEYKAQDYEEVEFYNPVTQRMEWMMPYVFIIIDTASSLRGQIYSGNIELKGSKDVFSNEAFIQKNLKLSVLTGVINSLFGKNVVTTWVAHIKENINMNGGRPEADFKSFGYEKKVGVPKSIKEKISWAISMYNIVDTSQKDKEEITKKDHIVNRLDIDPKFSPYSVLCKLPKSRTGSEAQTVTELPIFASKFHRIENIILDCDNMKIFKKAGGQHPSASSPHCFKDQDEELTKAMGRYRRDALKMDGYERIFNLMEAKLLCNYIGDNEELLRLKSQFLTACMNNLDKRLEYELEVNNVTKDEMQDNKTKIGALFSIYGAVKREDVFNKKKEDMQAAVIDDIDPEGKTHGDIEEE